MARHVLVAISAHGYGHAAQVAPVVSALRQRFQHVEITLYSALPHSYLARRFGAGFKHLNEACDVGLLMDSALDISHEESARAYARFHQDWEGKVRDQAKQLEHAAPDLVVADVPYLPLAGAAMAGIPAVALSSLNWADIYHHYFASRPEAPEIHSQILAAYRDADCFLQPEPSMPMEGLPRRRPIGTVAQLGVDRRLALIEKLGLHAGTRLVIVALGGVDFRVNIDTWPRLPGVHWLVPAAWKLLRPDATAADTLGFSFVDLLCSADALIGKPGYGSFSEAACHGLPVLYVRRGDWPEEACLVDWLTRIGRCQEIGREELVGGEIGDALHRLWRLPERAPVVATGADEVVEYLIENWLGPGCHIPVAVKAHEK